MIHRFTIAAIVFFWLLMNGALVRLVIDPGQSGIMTIPVEHVLKQVFLHEQTSSLVIYQGARRVGGLTLQPRRFEAERKCLVDFTGNLLLQIPFVGQQPFSWRGTAELDDAYALRVLRLHVDARSPSVVTDLEINRKKEVVSYTVQYDQDDAFSDTVPLSREGVLGALKTFGIDPTLLEEMAAGAARPGKAGPAVELTARQSQVRIHNERVQAFRLAVRQENSPLVEVDISQLGQVLNVKTAYGFSLSPEETLP